MGDAKKIGRRDAMQILSGSIGVGFALPGLPEGHPLSAHLADQAKVTQADRKAAAARWKPAFLGAHEFATLKSLADRIVPGASKAKTAEFIDQLLAVDTQGNQRSFLGAIGAFDGRALDRTRRAWIALSAVEQDEILREASTMPSGPLRDQFDLLKGWIAGTYYSSEIGMRELGWTGNVFFAEFPGCQHPNGHP
jgi:hypothetical protein